MFAFLLERGPTKREIKKKTKREIMFFFQPGHPHYQPSMDGEKKTKRRELIWRFPRSAAGSIQGQRRQTWPSPNKGTGLDHEETETTTYVSPSCMLVCLSVSQSAFVYVCQYSRDEWIDMYGCMYACIHVCMCRCVYVCMCLRVYQSACLRVTCICTVCSVCNVRYVRYVLYVLHVLYVLYVLYVLCVLHVVDVKHVMYEMYARHNVCNICRLCNTCNGCNGCKVCNVCNLRYVCNVCNVRCVMCV